MNNDDVDDDDDSETHTDTQTDTHRQTHTKKVNCARVLFFISSDFSIVRIVAAICSLPHSLALRLCLFVWSASWL